MTLSERVEALIHKVAWKTGEEATPIYLAEFEQVRAEGRAEGLEEFKPVLDAAQVVSSMWGSHGTMLDSNEWFQSIEALYQAVKDSAERIRAAKSPVAQGDS